MYEQRRALNVYAGEHGHISGLSATQWDIVSNLIDTLAPIEEVTMEMSNSESSAGCIIPSVSDAAGRGSIISRDQNFAQDHA